MIENHPHRTLADLRRKLVRRLAHIGSTLSGVGASGKPGAVQLRFTEEQIIGVLKEATAVTLMANRSIPDGNSTPVPVFQLP